MKDKFKIEENGLTIEANYDEDSKGCKLFRFTIDKKRCIINREFIYQLLVLMGTDEDIEKLTETNYEQITSTRRKLSLRAKKDIKEGEMIEVMIDFPVPTSTLEKIDKFSLKNNLPS